MIKNQLARSESHCTLRHIYQDASFWCRLWYPNLLTKLHPPAQCPLPQSAGINSCIAASQPLLQELIDFLK